MPAQRGADYTIIRLIYTIQSQIGPAAMRSKLNDEVAKMRTKIDAGESRGPPFASLQARLRTWMDWPSYHTLVRDWGVGQQGQAAV